MPAAPGAKDAARVTGGAYTIDPGHTQILFAYDHMGFSNNLGVLSESTGTLTLDPKNPSAAKVSVEVPIANLKTGIAKLDEHLMKPEFIRCRSEEHTSELQSLMRISYAVLCLKQKQQTKHKILN